MEATPLSMERASATARRGLESAYTYLVWACAAYVFFYVAGTWYGSGGVQNPGATTSPFAILWFASLAVVGIALLRRFLST